jgi:hypothetical protein
MTGVFDLRQQPNGRFKTVRINLPAFVSEVLKSFYDDRRILRGMPDLVIWDTSTHHVRFVEVKCQRRDKLTHAQIFFIAIAEERGYNATVVEWKFDDMEH